MTHDQPELSERRLAAMAACRAELRAGLRRAEEREAAWAKACDSQGCPSSPSPGESEASAAPGTDPGTPQGSRTH